MNDKEKRSLSTLVLEELESTAERISALKILESGKVPASAVQTRSSRGGKLSYIDHVWASSILRAAFGHLWSFDVGDVQLFELTSLDGKFEYPKFTMATCTLTVEVGGYRTSISEIGAFDNTMKLNPAAAGASAVHRALTKCLMLMFGVGAEFYKGYKPYTASAGDLWADILEYGTGQSLTEDQIVAAIKMKGITKDTLVSRFEEARDAVSAAIDKELIEDQFRPAPDPLVEAALELGGKVVDEGMPDFTGMGRKDTDPAIEELAVDQETGEILEPESIDWVKFYEWAGEQWDSRFGQFRASDARAILSDVFGAGLTRASKQAIAAAFLEWMKSDSNEDREAIREKYRE